MNQANNNNVPPGDTPSVWRRLYNTYAGAVDAPLHPKNSLEHSLEGV
jgi:hypothetical protein